MGQVHVLTGVERRRQWSDDQKRAIVAAAFAPGAVVAAVARQADVNSGQIYRWRRELRSSIPGFVEVVVPPSLPAPHGMSDAVIEVAIGDDVHVRFSERTPPALAASVIGLLVRR
jgi:transposase